MITIIRGTTPTLPLVVGTDLRGEDVYASFEWDGGQMTKRGDALDITADTVNVKLTQADTLGFPEGATITVQVKALDGQGNVRATEDGANARFLAGRSILETTLPLEG